MNRKIIPCIIALFNKKNKCAGFFLLFLRQWYDFLTPHE